MNITHDGSPWPVWKVRLVGISLPAWLCAAPSVVRYLWPAVMAGPVPALLSSALDLWGLWVAVGVALALAALSTDYHDHKTVQCVARWYLLGVCALLVALFVLP